MTDQQMEISFAGVDLEEWRAAYRPEIYEFYVSRFVFRKENGLVRIAVGREGPPVDSKGTNGAAVYTHAITVTEALALELSKKLRDIIADS